MVDHATQETIAPVRKSIVTDMAFSGCVAGERRYSVVTSLPGESRSRVQRARGIYNAYHRDRQREAR